LDESVVAERVVSAIVPPTPQYSWPLLKQRLSAEAWIQHEKALPAGEFQLRGATLVPWGIGWEKNSDADVCIGVLGVPEGVL
jgi:threonine dehydratase